MGGCPDITPKNLTEKLEIVLSTVDDMPPIPVQTVKSLGMVLDTSLSVKAQITKCCQAGAFPAAPGKPTGPLPASP